MGHGVHVVGQECFSKSAKGSAITVVGCYEENLSSTLAC